MLSAGLMVAVLTDMVVAYGGGIVAESSVVSSQLLGLGAPEN